jgi:MFS family permease
VTSPRRRSTIRRHACLASDTDIDTSTTKGLYAVADFRRLWFIGFTGSVVRWFEMLAFGLVAYQLTESAFVVAMVGMLRLLPMGLFGAFLGVAADRFERRTALIVSVSVSLATSLALLALASFGAISVWHLAAASFINGTCWAADNPVRRVMIGDVVGAERMAAAMSLDIGTNNASRVLGPGLSGLLLAYFEIESVFAFSAALYCGSLAAALRIQIRHGRTAHAASFLASLRESFAWALNDRRLVGIFVITVIFNVFGWPFTSMIPVIGTDYLRLGAGEVGMLASCDGMGGLAAALVVGALLRPGGYGRVYVTAVGVYLALVIGFAVAPNSWLAALFLLLSGVSSVGFAITQNTLVYRNAPAEMRARLLGLLSLFIGTAPIGFVYLGFLAEILTPRVGTVALAAQGVLALVFTRRYWMSVLRA